MKPRSVTAEYEIKSNKLKKPVTVGLISDLHERDADDIFALLRGAEPDLIAVAGDSFERYSGKYLEARRRQNPVKSACFVAAYHIDRAIRFIFRVNNSPLPENSYRFLRRSARLAPVFLSLGNHEEELLGEDMDFFAANGITLLDNSYVKTVVNGQELIIGGLSTEYDEDLPERLSRENGFKLMLCHHPEYYERLLKDKDIDLILSGHNHGGQFRIFGKGLLSSSTGLFPKYDRGLFDGRLVVSAGCANTTAIPRFFNPREAVIIRLLPD